MMEADGSPWPEMGLGHRLDMNWTSKNAPDSVARGFLRQRPRRVSVIKFYSTSMGRFILVVASQTRCPMSMLALAWTIGPKFRFVHFRLKQRPSVLEEVVRSTEAEAVRRSQKSTLLPLERVFCSWVLGQQKSENLIQLVVSLLGIRGYIYDQADFSIASVLTSLT